MELTISQNKNVTGEPFAPLAGMPKSLASLMDEMGVCRVTMWRWRRAGWLSTITIAGREYVTPDSLAEFNRRAMAGELAGTKNQPKRNGGAK